METSTTNPPTAGQPAAITGQSTVDPVKVKADVDVADAISKDTGLPDNIKPTLIQKILDKLNIKDLPPDQKDAIIQEEIAKAKAETGKIQQGSFTNSVAAPKLSAAEKVAIFTSVGTGLAAIADSIKTNPVLQQLAVAGAGLILATPLVGQCIMGGIALCAVAYYAVLAVKAKFQGLYTVLRTLDEFTILLEKIQRMIRVTVFISGTYNFQINIDEINNQITIILKRFEKTLSDVDIKKIESEATDAINLKNLSANTSNSAAGATMAESKAAAAADAQTNQPEIPKVGSNSQSGGGWSLANFYKKFTFPVEPWNRELLDDVTKLNIRLTTAMGEFTIVLNVIQMNMIADGFRVLKPPTGEPKNAVDKFVDHTTKVKDSSEYKKMRIGILINDILSLRVDFEFCNQGNRLTRPNDDAICLEYTQTDTAGNRIMTFRTKLHGFVIALCRSLMDGEGYDDAFKDVVKKNVIDPYITLLQDAKIPSQESKLTIADTLDKLNLKETSLTPIDKDAIDNGLETLVNAVNNALKPKPKPTLKGGSRVRGTQVGGIWGFGKSAPAGPTAAQINIIKYLKNNPVEIISHAALTLYLENVYKFSKEISKPSEKERNETASAVKHTEQVGAAPAGSAVPGGGSRRNRKRPTTRKYIKSSSSVKKGKTYKIRI